MRMADDQMQTRQIRQLRRQPRQRLGAGLHEGRPQQQVLGRVAAEREFGRQHDGGALRMGGARGLRQQAGVAGEVADRGVDLRDGQLHGFGP